MLLVTQIWPVPVNKCELGMVFEMLPNLLPISGENILSAKLKNKFLLRGT
jgi:hypothetical protein